MHSDHSAGGAPRPGRRLATGRVTAMVVLGGIAAALMGFEYRFRHLEAYAAWACCFCSAAWATGRAAAGSWGPLPDPADMGSWGWPGQPQLLWIRWRRDRRRWQSRG